MKPIDIRNENWESVRGRASGLRLVVWDALAKRGPATTRQLAEFAGIDLLTVRPRVTELVELGLVEIVGKVHRGEGLYAAVPPDEARRRWEQRAAATRQPAEQMLMPVG